MSAVPDALVEKASDAMRRGGGCTPEEIAREALAAVLPEIRAEALRDAAQAWSWGDWASAPRRADRVQERLANAQYVGVWLRGRAAHEDQEDGGDG